MREYNRIVCIFWGPNSPQTEDFARRLNAPLYKIHYLRHKSLLLAPIKYIPMFLKTMWVLYKQRPSVVFVANTPVFAPLSVFLYCRFAGISYIMDIHGHSFIGWKWRWSAPLQYMLARKALASMVDHSEHERVFESRGAKTFILERPPIEPPFKDENSAVQPDPFTVTVINTFAGDEPLKPIIEAARHLPDFRFIILGDKSKAKKGELRQAPENVIFPGYLLSDKYWAQLSGSNVIMTLTTTPYSLVSGGIEGLTIGKPLLLSCQPALTEYFTKGAIFVDHSAESIRDGVEQARAQEDRLKKEIAELAREKRQRWENEFRKLIHLIGEET